MAGDFNARIGTDVPPDLPQHVLRASADRTSCQRRLWFLSLCVTMGCYIHNGLQPGPPAQYTCTRPQGQSVVDYICSKDPSLTMGQCDMTLEGISDHAVLSLELPGPQCPAAPAASAPAREPVVKHTWVGGEALADYASSAHTWS